MLLTDNNITTYVKIIILNWEETKEIDCIEGRVTSGNISLNGDSTVRRTANISFSLTDWDDSTTFKDTLTKKTKIKISIGEIRGNQTSITWNNLGIFLVKTYSENKSVSNFSISVSVTDKMSLLSGELGGNLPAAVTFSEMETKNSDGTTVKEYPLFKDIIRTLVTQYGGIDKIKIYDVDDSTKQVMKWGKKVPLYKYELGGSLFLDTTLPAGAAKKAQYNYEDIVGYIEIPYTWPGATLTANIGDTITSVLDKLKAIANYEYFFDKDGTFIWQTKKNYTYQTVGGSVSSEEFFNGLVDKIVKPSFEIDQTSKEVKVSYIFDDLNIITAITNTPQYNNIKNDYIVWGKRKTASGSELPIRYRLIFSNTLGKVVSGIQDGLLKYQVFDNIDGYKKCNIKELSSVSSLPYQNDNIYYKIQGKFYHYNGSRYEVVNDPSVSVAYDTNTNFRSVVYLKGAAAEESYFNNPLYKDLELEWPKLWDIDKNDWQAGSAPVGDDIDYFCHVIDVPGLNVEDTGRYQTKVVNDTTINCIYSPDIPADILHKINDKYNIGSNDINIEEEVYNSLYAGGSQNSAFEQTRRLVNYYTSYNNSITLTAIPVYTLEPNTIIQIKFDDTNIDGYYVIKTISLPLAYNGTMSVTATQALTQDATSK